MSRSPWTPESDAKLRKFVAEGLSYGEIGGRLGIGKNAAIGRAHRLGLKNGRATNGHDERIPAPEPAPKPFRDGCRFITDPDYLSTIREGKGEDIYCGKPRIEVMHKSGEIVRRDWCAEHFRIVYVPIGKRAPQSVLLALSKRDRLKFAELRRQGLSEAEALQKLTEKAA